MVFRRIEKESTASLLQLWVWCEEAWKDTHEIAHKEHKHVATQRQQHHVKKTGGGDLAFNISSAMNVQLWSYPNQ